MGVDIRLIRKLVKIIEESNVDELEINEGELHLRIKKSINPISVPNTPTIFTQPAPVVTASIPSEPPPKGAEKPVEEKTSEAADIKTITSPMVGTFYRASAPDADPFVKVGTTVDAETTVCIIEAMKVMNEIKAEMSGTIIEVLVENGQPVEFGQPLFKLQPTT